MGARDSLGTVELMVILAILRLSDDAYGVPIAREIEESTGRRALLGSVYATLVRLEAKGLVSSRLGEATAERGGRAKRYFRVTSKGVREARVAQRALTRLSAGLRQLAGEVA